ncbi:hypothetical protein [Pseudomonas sp.]|uniref:hypothetical protein n=1 Tax=Pseudomonas sp. TaxID=306 RepID=UPI003D12317B
MAHVLAIYEVDRAWGGPEEGGWWFDCGTLVRIVRVVGSADRAASVALRANRLLERLQRAKRPVSSIAYEGGRHCVLAFEDIAPPAYPAVTPRYE